MLPLPARFTNSKTKIRLFSYSCFLRFFPADRAFRLPRFRKTGRRHYKLDKRFLDGKAFDRRGIIGADACLAEMILCLSCDKHNSAGRR